MARRVRDASGDRLVGLVEDLQWSTDPRWKAAVARAEGIDLSEADITRWHDVLQRLAPEGKTSMLQDIEAGRKTEVEMLAGQLTERAARHGIEAHCNEALFHMIKVYEARSGAVS